MAKNKRAAERRRRKALKRAERRRRRSEAPPPRSGVDGFELMRKTIEPWLDEVEAAPPCSSAVAERFAAASDDLAATLATGAEEARDALEEWPDDERTRELRTLLLELAGEAERDAAKWCAFEERLSALVEQAGHHVHLDEGKLVAGDEHDDSSTVDDIPY